MIDEGIAGVTSVNLGDLNRDGKLDIAVFQGGRHADVATFAWFEAPDWTRHEFNIAYQPGPFIGDSEIGDINGDGWLDIVVPEDNHSGDGDGDIYWYENPQGNATASWTRHPVAEGLSLTVHIGDIELADMDNDGKLDVVARHLGERQVRICFQNGPEDWTVRSFPVRAREGMKLADLDRDGRMDIVLNGFWWAAPANARTGDYTEYTIDSAFYSLPDEGLNNSTKNGIGDIDGDGIDDVVISTAEGGDILLAWYRCPSNPRTQSWTKHVIESDFTNCHQAEIGDFDGDGDLDIAGGFAFGDEGIHIWENLGGGLAWNQQTVNSVLGLYSGVIGDLEPDGDLDIVGPSTYAGSGVLYIHENLRSDTGDPPQAPTSLDAYRNADGHVVLTWQDESGDETGFHLERLSPSGEFRFLADAAPDAVTFTDTDVCERRPYLYRVRAYNLAGSSAWSDTFAMKANLDCTGPPAPYAYWPLDDDASDQAGNNDGTPVNVNFVPGGYAGGTASFDSATDRIALGAMDLGPIEGVTITAWIRWNGGGHVEGRIISKASGTSGNEHDWMLSLNNSTQLRFRLKAGGSTATLVSPSGVIQENTWQFVAAVYDGQSMVLYVDGEEVDRMSKSGTVTSEPSVSAAIGNQPMGTGDRPFGGLIDDVRMYPFALSACEVQPDPCLNAAAGDSECDGDIDSDDVLAMPECLTGPTTVATCYRCTLLDLNGDGVIDLRDYSLILARRQ